jgi:uncharacterized protein
MDIGFDSVTQHPTMPGPWRTTRQPFTFGVPMQRKISFSSGENALRGVLHVPDGLLPGERRPAVIVVHGFGGNKDGPSHSGECALYESLGYVALRFDMRGCGESDGPRGRVICHEQVEDASNAVTWLAAQECVRPGAIALSGQSFGGAVVMYTAAVDTRVAAVVSIGGWGNGERKLRWQNRAPGAWQRLMDQLSEGKRLRETSGETLFVKRWDIVPIPENIRHLLPPDSIMEFPFDTPQSIYDFRPEDVVARIRPRPFLVMHGADDSVTSMTEALRISEASQGWAELAILRGEHFPFARRDDLWDTLMEKWLARNLPIAQHATNKERN